MSSKLQLSSTTVPKVLYENRYCDQEEFSILVCGGIDKSFKRMNQVLQIKVPSFEVTEFPSMENYHDMLKIATINSDICAIVDSVDTYELYQKTCTSVEIYFDKTKTWRHCFFKFEERYFYSFCSFMNKLYVIGGWNKSDNKSLCSCYNYNVNNIKDNKVADLNQARYGAPCTVFEGKIVVAGGFLAAENCDLKSVEAYDFNENTWTYLPDMIEKRCNHASVSNKMFVIGGTTSASCEVFDSHSRKFTAIKSDIKLSAADKTCFDAFCIGYNIVVFQHYVQSGKRVIHMYDVNKSRWSQIDCGFLKNYFLSSYVKY